MGWTYAFYLFNHFGISLNSIEIPFYYFFVYSYSVITGAPAIIAVGVALIVICLVTSFAPICLKEFPLKKWALILLLILLFPTFFSIAKKRAVNDALNIRSYGRKVIFVFKKDATKLYPKEFINANNENKLKILTQTNDRFYVLYQPEGERNAIPKGFTYDIARVDILLAKIEMQNIIQKGIKNE